MDYDIKTDPTVPLEWNDSRHVTPDGQLFICHYRSSQPCFPYVGYAPIYQSLNHDFTPLGGSITLASNNPLDSPNIDPGLLRSEFDVFTMRNAVRSAQRFLSARAWAQYILAPFGELANATTDAELDTYIRANTATIFHPVGTAAMSPKGAKWGVVDPDLLVKGTFGLRVVDASILVSLPSNLLNKLTCAFYQPTVPAAHTQAPVYVVAERAADLIKERWQ